MNNIHSNLKEIKILTESIKILLRPHIILVVEKITKSNNFSDLDKYITKLNDPNIANKNFTFNAFCNAIDTIKINDTSILLYLLWKKQYTFFYKGILPVNHSFNNYENMLFRDIVFLLFENDYGNPNLKRMKFYFWLFYVSYLVHFYSGNVYLLIANHLHSEFFIDLNYHLLTEKIFLNFQLGKIKDFWYMFNTYYANYIYGDIIEFKYKKYNEIWLFTNIDIYKIFHTTYQKRPDTDEKFKEEFINAVNKLKLKDTTKYTSDNYLSSMISLFHNPDCMKVLLVNLSNTEGWDSTSEESKYEHLIVNQFVDTYNSDNEVNSFTYDNNIEKILETFWVKKNDPIFFVFYHSFFWNKSLLRNVVENTGDILWALESFLWMQINNPRKYTISLNNLYMEEKITDTDREILDNFILK